MRKILILLLFLTAALTYSQTNATFKNLDVRNRTTLRGYNYLYDSTFFLPDGSNIPYWDASDTLGYVLSVSNPNESQLVKVRLSTLLDSLGISGGADSLYIAYGCFDNLDTWLYNSDTIYIDTCVYLNDLQDVVLTIPDSGDILRFDDNSNTWVNVPLPVTDSVDYADTAGYAPQYWTFVDAATDTLKNNVSTAGVVAIKGNLELQTTNAAATEGVVKQNGVGLLHTYTDNANQPNLFFGSNSGNYTLTGNYNIGIGDSTLLSITTNGQNIAIGRKVLAYGIAVANNVAIGYLSMSSTTGSDDNVAIGYQSLANGVNSFSNVAIGKAAMYGTATKSQQYNVAVGSDAMYNVGDGGDYNVAVGSQSLYSQKGRRGSTAVGYQAMYYGYGAVSTANGYNTAVGHQAMYGSNNPANNSGTKNTAVGAQALDGMTSGSFNTVYGYDAGGGITTGDSNILIGTSAGAQLTTQSDQLYIDNTNTTTPLIHGNFRTDELTVNGDLFLNPIPDEATKVGRIAHINQFGKIEWVSPSTLYDTMQQAVTTTPTPYTTWLRDDAKASIFQGTLTDKVGIGLNNPTSMLHIKLEEDSVKTPVIRFTAGSTYLGGIAADARYNYAFGLNALANVDTGYNHIAIGYHALEDIRGGNHNIAIGFEAMADAGSTSTGSIGIGYGALFKNNSSTNTAIGLAAMLSNVTGSCNTAVGASALRYSNTLDNVAVGSDAMSKDTCGTENVAVGTWAQYSNKGGDKNVGIGQNSLYTNAGGDENVAVGFEAMKLANGAAANNAVGHSALYTNVVGIGNQAFGKRALYQTTANYSIGIGENAGNGSTTAGLGVYIGANSGYTGNTIGAVYIGTSAGYYQRNTSYSGTGEINTIIGFNAGYGVAGSDGSGLTILGNTAGYSLRDGNFDVLIGGSAGYSLLDGGYSTFVGFKAGYSSAAGLSTALGYNAIYNSTGTHCLGIGVLAGYTNSTTGGVIYIGSNSGYYQTNSRYATRANTIIGTDAAYGASGSDGSGNTGVGHKVLNALVDGDFNVAVGNDALDVNTNGSQNTAIGVDALGGNVTGSGNVALGHSAGSAETGSNKLYIDNSNTATPLIHGDFNTNQLWLNGKVQIGGTESSNANDLFVDGTMTTMNSNGELWDNAGTVIATTNVYRTITSLQAGDYTNVTLGDSSMTILQAGTYLVNYSSSFTHSVNNTVCHVSLFVNDTEDTSLEAEHKIGTAGDVGSMSGTALVAVTANAVLKLRVISDNAGNTTFNHINFNAIRIK